MNILASASKDGSVKVWRLSDRESVFDSHKIPIKTSEGAYYSFVFFSDDEQTLYYGGSDGKVFSVKVFKGSHLSIAHKEKNAVNCADFDPSSNKMLLGVKDKIKILDAKSEKIVKEIDACKGKIMDLKYNGDNTKIGCLCDNGEMTLWTKTGKKIHSWVINEKATQTQITFSNDGKWLVSGGAETFVKVWDISNYQLNDLLAGHQDNIQSVDFSPDSKSILSGGDDQMVKIWRWKKVYANVNIPTPPPPAAPKPAIKENLPVLEKPVEQNTAAKKTGRPRRKCSYCV